MKVYRSVAVAAAAVLLPLGMSLPATAAPGTNDSPTDTESIIFDGFCDGFTINLPSSGLGTAGTLDGAQSGCESNPIFGTAAPKKGEYSVTAGREFVTIQAYGIYTVVRNDNTFSHYMLVGDQMIDALDGTWSLAAPGDVPAGAPSSIATAQAAAGDGGVAVKGPETLEISFDGFCDGMTLTNPSTGNGQKRTVEGQFTGCAAGQLLMGSKGLVQGVAQSYSLTTDNGGGMYMHTVISRDHTWAHYALDDSGLIYLLNSGTWTEGPPPAGAAGLSSSRG